MAVGAGLIDPTMLRVGAINNAPATVGFRTLEPFGFMGTSGSVAAMYVAVWIQDDIG